MSVLKTHFLERLTKPVRAVIGYMKALLRKKREYQQIRVVRNSRLFDSKWYYSMYDDVADSGVNPAKHYYLHGWKEGRDPSGEFSTKEYLELYADVKNARMCPLYHYERYGRVAGRHYRIDVSQELEPNTKEKWKDFVETGRQMVKAALMVFYYATIPIASQKVLFTTYQHEYVCNPKYICEELLKQKVPCEIVWLCKTNDQELEEVPDGVRCVKFGSPEAKKELASAKIVIENGTMLFSRKLPKKRGQICLCTWHGSMGFKRLGIDTAKSKATARTIKMYGKIHDVVLTNSDFEDHIFRESYWPHTTFWKFGHPRNDILFVRDPGKIQQIKEKVCVKLGISPESNLALYAPTFRDVMINGATHYVPDEVLKRGSYLLDYGMLRQALEERFGGHWVILARHHFYNGQNKTLQDMLPEGVVRATDYNDMQELMVAADVGITDYSSWILDFMLTQKPGFLFAVDINDYEQERGLYYPLSQSPFPVVQTSIQLCEKIKEFQLEEYKDAIQTFLKEKGCVEDGQASMRVVNKIREILT